MHRVPVTFAQGIPVNLYEFLLALLRGLTDPLHREYALATLNQSNVNHTKQDKQVSSKMIRRSQLTNLISLIILVLVIIGGLNVLG